MLGLKPCMLSPRSVTQVTQPSSPTRKQKPSVTFDLHRGGVGPGRLLPPAPPVLAQALCLRDEGAQGVLLEPVRVLEGEPLPVLPLGEHQLHDGRRRLNPHTDRSQPWDGGQQVPRPQRLCGGGEGDRGDVPRPPKVVCGGGRGQGDVPRPPKVVWWW